MRNCGIYKKRQDKAKKFLMLILIFLVVFCFGVKKTEEALVDISPRLIILPPIDGLEWEDTVDIAATVKMIKKKFGRIIILVSKEHGVQPKIIIAIVVVESGGDPNAVSEKGAYGLMQLKKGTARDMGIADPFHPYDNLWAGTKYLKQQLKRFGSLALALAAYNMGPARLERRIKNGFNPDYNIYIRRVETVLLYM